MKLGIIGLPGSGKTTIFEALTQNIQETGHKAESRIGTIRVPDERVGILSNMYQPAKTIYAQVEYFLPATAGVKKDQNLWTEVRDCDALIQVVRNFRGFGEEAPDPRNDFISLQQEMILSDLVVVEKRMERLAQDQKRGKKGNPEELSLLTQCLKHLENEIPIRKFPEIVNSQLLRGFAFMTSKPLLVLFNNEDDDNSLPEKITTDDAENCMVIRGKLERELSQMSPEEMTEFLEEFNITASAMDRVIKRSYEILGLIAFFTVGKDEVRAWTIRKETIAMDAAEVIHTDLKKGFIRAEVVSYTDLMDAGTFPEAKKRGTVRLEGKTYLVQDGDIINVRFNV